MQVREGSRARHGASGGSGDQCGGARCADISRVGCAAEWFGERTNFTKSEKFKAHYAPVVGKPNAAGVWGPGHDTDEII